MALSWNEIKDRSIRFYKDWENVSGEDAEAKTFWDEFFNVFGISRRKVASFEKPVKRLDESIGYIEMLWKGMILVEHKSRGKDLDKAYKQALEYFPGLKDFELPKYVLVSDFARFRLYDMDDDGNVHEFELNDLYKNIREFGFIAGYQKHTFTEQDPVNIHAAEMMGKLHDRLKAVGYEGHVLEVYLIRLLFCLFAEDTSIFERDQLRDYLINKTKDDGSDLAQHLSMLFYVLNTPKDKRLRNLDEDLAAFPYINGRLFEETLPPASFDTTMRNNLMECTMLNWGKISPAIFGSLFQSVMNPVERRNLGAHYTSEKNIMKVIKPLFLDDLWKEFHSVKDNRNKLIRFHDKLASLRFLDPACGCGNFLVITYREIRLLELEIIRVLQKGQQVFDVGELIKLDVDRFYGIEIEEFPSQIAQVALWLMDHQMNMLVSEAFGQYFLRLPLRKSPNITCGNALRIDWQSLIEPIPWEQGAARFDYIFGNPPFLGKQYQNKNQKDDMELVFNGILGTGILDFVTAWYLRAGEYLTSISDSSSTKCAFVSTNSISQGEQVGILWRILNRRFHLKIFFAHRTFKWSNEARGKAAVHVVIIGFTNHQIQENRLFGYENITGEPLEVIVKSINPYLVEGKDNFISKRRKPICNVPEMAFGNMPNDGGHLIFTTAEKDAFLKIEPSSLILFREFIGSHEFLNGSTRWCLWLKGADPSDLRKLPQLQKRLELVRKARLASNRPTTNKLAEYPYLFGEIRQPDSDYLIFPEVSSERRKYIPVGYISKEIITSNKNYTIVNATFYHFGVLSSIMNMAWIKTVSGRLKSDIQYSSGIVYNNFPWPESPTEKQVKTVEDAAQKVLYTRLNFPGSSLADLYDPLTMPPDLVKAHQELDKAVDLCYRPQPFLNETKRIEFLFELYEKYTAGLFAKEKNSSKKRN
ncbi:MAG: N-6 DNA methylase [Bacteroidetes bacterium]|nr:N-6 DNA methylase [Bacteroidota bacterium]